MEERLRREAEQPIGEWARSEARDITDSSHVACRHLSAQFQPIGADDAKERRAFIVGSAERGHDVCDSPGDRRAEHERIAGRQPATGTECLIALRQPGFGRLEARVCDGDSAPSVLHAPRRNRSFRQQPLRSCLFSVRGF